MARLQAGQHFRWSVPSSHEAGEAVVNTVRNNRQEGLAPEAQDDAALWAEVTGLSGSRAGQQFTLVLTTEDKPYLDGHPIQIEPL